MYSSKPLLPVLAAVAALAAPGLARAGDVAMRVQEVPQGTRSLAAVQPAIHFNMLAVHWIGSGSVLVRTHRLHGRWTPWAAADSNGDTTGRWNDGGVNWTGASDAYGVRRVGAVGRLRVYELWSRVTTPAPRSLAQAGQPVIVSRSGWGAEEDIVRAKPTFAPALKLAVVHHTAGTNAYTRAQAPAIVRGIEVYHVQGNGWNDIGYNFLVDRFGTVYEGRGGGIDRNVIGAHAEGFNSGTVGVSLIGNFSQATPPKPMQDALVGLLAWRLDVAHIDPLSTVVYTSGGNYKFRSGKVVTLRAISGHRDTGPSECPGNGAYALLPALAKRVAATGLPKLYGPTVAGALGGPVRFEARLSSALGWTVTVADQDGKTVASGAGHGALVDWTWSSQAVGKGRFTWTIAAPGVLAATGMLGVPRPVPPPAPTLTNLATAPAIVTPAGDGTGADSTVTFTVGTASHVTAQLLDETGAVALALADQQVAAGPGSFTWSAATLPDGRYRVVVTATAGTKSVSKAAEVIVDRTLTGLVASGLSFSFTLAATVPLQLTIEQPGGLILATPFSGQLPAGDHTIDWDGTANGAKLPPGDYLAVFTVTDALGDVQLTVPIVIQPS